jgi:hypothetical protein
MSARPLHSTHVPRGIAFRLNRDSAIAMARRRYGPAEIDRLLKIDGAKWGLVVDVGPAFRLSAAYVSLDDIAALVASGSSPTGLVTLELYP